MVVSLGEGPRDEVNVFLVVVVTLVGEQLGPLETEVLLHLGTLLVLVFVLATGFLQTHTATVLLLFFFVIVVQNSIGLFVGLAHGASAADEEFG